MEERPVADGHAPRPYRVRDAERRAPEPFEALERAGPRPGLVLAIQLAQPRDLVEEQGPFDDQADDLPFLVVRLLEARDVDVAFGRRGARGDVLALRPSSSYRALDRLDVAVRRRDGARRARPERRAAELYTGGGVSLRHGDGAALPRALRHWGGVLCCF